VSKIPLEDDFNDIIAKAQHGLSLSDDELARRAGVAAQEVTKARRGEFDETTVRKLASALNLNADALVAIGEKAWYPKDIGKVVGLACFSTAYDDMRVNSYFIWDPETDNGACLDTGADASPMIQFAADREIRIQMVLLTHTHSDHIADLERLTAETGAKAFASKLEAIPGVETFEPGENIRVGKLVIETRATSGHSRGGITYVVEGLARRIAVVGDAIFAGSMGGGMVSYEDALRNNCEHILTLPEDTILCPGHGPLTTVGEEKEHNPFFASLYCAVPRS
jgi:glyoxylase-like metal-dependent hydrolase (beta-lactamase superfamily II)